MIDWIRIIFDWTHEPIHGGKLISIDADGVEEWVSLKRNTARSSFEDAIQFKSQGGNGKGVATEIYIDGNATKFIQAHNVFGTMELLPLVQELVKQLGQLYGFDSSELEDKAIKGQFSVLGLHINKSFDAGSPVRAQAIQDTLALKSRTRQGRCQTRGHTNYWNMSDRKTRWIIKSYLKHQEITTGRKKGQKLKPHLKGFGIEDYAESLVRVELEIYKQELKEHGLLRGYQFTPEILNKLFAQYWERVEMSLQADIPSERLEGMPKHFRSTFLTWKAGINPRPMLSKATFYKHRSFLLGHGIDISIPHEQEASAKVIPMLQTIEAREVGIPDFAYRHNLVFDPRKKAA